MTPLVYLNGEYIAHDHARVSVDDRGFLFADGVYEVLRAPRGIPFELGRHLRRLAFGLSELRIHAPPDIDAAALGLTIGRLLAENSLQDGDATVYIQITRGAAPRTHAFPRTAVSPTVYLRAAAFTPHDALRGRGAAAITRPDIRWTRCDIKGIGLVANVLANQAAAEAGVNEAIFVRDGVVTEGSHTNVCAVIDGAVHTHPADNLILRGITRDVVLEIARETGIGVHERPVPLDELRAASEVLLLGTTMDVMPVVSLDGHPIADGRPGPIAARLFDGLSARMGTRGSRAGGPAAAGR